MPADATPTPAPDVEALARRWIEQLLASPERASSALPAGRKPGDDNAAGAAVVRPTPPKTPPARASRRQQVAGAA